jgi:hypothetical protein
MARFHACKIKKLFHGSFSNNPIAKPFSKRMKTPRNKYYLLNHIFLFCLVILVVNDHYLKYEYANWFTGKLSDMVGIIMLPLLITWLFPAVKERSIVISAALFIFWKSPFSQGLIYFYNQFAFIQTSRIVDYTDLFVLALLPIPWFLLKRIDSLHALKITRVNPILILLPTVFSLMATSPPPYFRYTRTKGNLSCLGCHITVNYNQDEILAMFKEDDIVFDKITPAYFEEFIEDYDKDTTEPILQDQNGHYYKLNKLVIEKDTLRDIDFTMRTFKNKKTRIYFNGMNVSDDISTGRLMMKARKHYRRLLFRLLKHQLKD